jgi:hypothetical protein
MTSRCTGIPDLECVCAEVCSVRVTGSLDPEMTRQIQRDASQRGINVSAVSGLAGENASNVNSDIVISTGVPNTVIVLRKESSP